MGGLIVDIPLAAFLIAATVSDLRTRRIPNALVGAMAACWAALMFAEALLLGFGGSAGEGALMRLAWHAGASLLGAGLLGGFVFALTCAFERATDRFAMGGGDIKLISCIALYLGFEGGCIALLVACVAAVLASALLHSFGRAVPRGPKAVADAPALACLGSGNPEGLVPDATQGRMPCASAAALPFAPALAIGALCACILAA